MAGPRSSKLVAAPIAGLALVMGIPKTGHSATYTYTVLAKTVDTGAKGKPYFFQGEPSINDSGVVVWGDATFCKTSSNPNNECAEVWTWSGGSNQLRLKSLLGGVAGTFFDAGTAGINDAGIINLIALSTPGGITKADIRSLDGKALTVISPLNALLSASIAELSNGGELALISNPNIEEVLGYVTSNGKFVRVGKGTCVQNVGTDVSPGGLWAYRAIGPVEGQSCAGAVGIYVTNVVTNGTPKLWVADQGSYGSLIATTIDDAGLLAFSNRTVDSSKNNLAGLYLYDIAHNGTPSELASINNGKCAFGSGPTKNISCSTSDFGGPFAISSGGTLAINVNMETWAAPGELSGTSDLVAINGDVVDGIVLAPGMTVGSCNVQDVLIGQRAINAAGQVVMTVTCSETNGSTYFQIILATPN